MRQALGLNPLDMEQPHEFLFKRGAVVALEIDVLVVLVVVVVVVITTVGYLLRV
jgi:hypothetical protein